MTDLIRVQPIRAHLVDFARWAVAQTPKVRTVSTNTFAVPPHLFTHMPETLLIGSIVDGHRYVSPDEDQEPTEPADGPQLLGVGQPEQEGIPGRPLPDVPATAYGPDATPLPPPDFAPLEDTDDDSSGLVCDVCSKPFKNERGLATHRRQVHPED
ncbi:hypothetical protein [Streptomyces sp. NPDC058891]|uniref:hypothetical protein n=1 Tax=Streptomyces sp. NPDC058891 TaxID=3346667 RepID=UPI003674F1E3